MYIQDTNNLNVVKNINWFKLSKKSSSKICYIFSCCLRMSGAYISTSNTGPHGITLALDAHAFKPPPPFLARQEWMHICPPKTRNISWSIVKCLIDRLREEIYKKAGDLMSIFPLLEKRWLWEWRTIDFIFLSFFPVVFLYWNIPFTARCRTPLSSVYVQTYWVKQNRT